MSIIGILKIMEVQEDDMEVQEEAVVAICWIFLLHFSFIWICLYVLLHWSKSWGTSLSFL